MTSLNEPPEVELLRGPLSKRATSAEFNEWQAREVVAYIDSLLSQLDATRAERDGLRTAVEQIAAIDFVEAALDPEWAVRVARAALKHQGAET